MAPLEANQDAKTTNGRGELLGETASMGKHPVPLTAGTMFARLAGIGVLLLGVVGAFLCLGGWFSPQKLTPARFVDEFERAGGIHSGFRRNHAKGLCVRGFFDSNGQGARLSKAVVFQSGRVPVIGRFSLGGGDPHTTDELSTVRGLGLQFSLPDGEQWRTAMIDLPVFPFKDPQAFYGNLVASQSDPNTLKPDPAKGAAFLASHPETARALAIIKSHSPSSGFDNAAYYSLNAFRFVNADGISTYVRWTLAPVQPYQAGTGGSQEKNFLFDRLIASIQQHPLQWHLVMTIAQPGDPTDNATIQWPPGREQVDVGTLTLDSVESEETSPARDINFDPLVLPGRHGAVQRSLAERAVGGLLAIVYEARRRNERAERNHAFRGAKVSTRTTTDPQQFSGSMRFLHWLMAAMVLTMLGIGVAMVASLGDYHRLVSIHRPLGIAILIVVVIRFVNRQFSTLPPFPASMSSQERFVAHASEILLYTLLFVLPLIGWGMLSAARYPIVLFGSLHLFPILPHSVMLYAFLRRTHTILAYLLFLAFVAHFGAVLFHTLIVRDGMLSRMVPWRVRAR